MPELHLTTLDTEIKYPTAETLALFVCSTKFTAEPHNYLCLNNRELTRINGSALEEII